MIITNSFESKAKEFQKRIEVTNCQNKCVELNDELIKGTTFLLPLVVVASLPSSFC